MLLLASPGELTRDEPIKLYYFASACQVNRDIRIEKKKKKKKKIVKTKKSQAAAQDLSLRCCHLQQPL